MLGGSTHLTPYVWYRARNGWWGSHTDDASQSGQIRLSIAIAGLYFNLAQSARHGHRFDLRERLNLNHSRYYQEVCSQYNEGYTDWGLNTLSLSLYDDPLGCHNIARIRDYLCLRKGIPLPPHPTRQLRVHLYEDFSSLESLIMNLNQTSLPKDLGRNYSNNWPNPKSDWTQLTRGQLRVREPAFFLPHLRYDKGSKWLIRVSYWWCV